MGLKGRWAHTHKNEQLEKNLLRMQHQQENIQSQQQRVQAQDQESYQSLQQQYQDAQSHVVLTEKILQDDECYS